MRPRGWQGHLPGTQVSNSGEAGPGEHPASSARSILHPPDGDGIRVAAKHSAPCFWTGWSQFNERLQSRGFPPTHTLFFPLFPGPWQESSPGLAGLV